MKAVQESAIAEKKAGLWLKMQKQVKRIREKDAKADEDENQDGDSQAKEASKEEAVLRSDAAMRGGQLLAFLDVHHTRLFGVTEREKAAKEEPCKRSEPKWRGRCRPPTGR